MRMVELGRDARFAQEALAALGVVVVADGRAGP
jgi:hypothetical protein